MKITTELATFHFPADFDDRAEFEMTPRGYLSGGQIELPDGRRYPVTFYDPVRLAQDVESGVESGVPMLAEPGLVVIPKITREALRQTIPELVRERFFDHLNPKPLAIANGVAH